jgi:hypothetical protein
MTFVQKLILLISVFALCLLGVGSYFIFFRTPTESTGGPFSRADSTSVAWETLRALDFNNGGDIPKELRSLNGAQIKIPGFIERK